MRRSVGVVLAAAVVALSGCASESEGVDLPEVDASSSSTPTVPEGVPTDPAPEPPADQSNTKKSAKEFTEYFVDLYFYAYAVRDAAPLEDVMGEGSGPDGCGGACDETEADMENDERKGVYEVGAFPKVVEVGQQVKLDQKRRLMYTVYDEVDEKLVYDDGRPPKQLKPDKGTYLEVLVQWDQGEWKVLDFGFPN